MKFLAVFAAVLAVASATNSWTLEMLSEATTNPHTDPALKPHLEVALNEMMTALWAGQNMETITVTIPSTDVSGMTLNELSEALQNPETDPALLPYLETALNQMMDAIFNDKPVESVVVAAPTMEIHYYTLHDLSMALQDPSINPELIPYLQHALNEMMSALFAGEDMNAIVIAVPAGLTPVEVPVIPVMPVVPGAPVQPEVPVVPVGPIVPVGPVVPETPVSSASPLVQIIININQQQEAVAVPVAPVVVPTEIVADPVNVVDSAPIVDPIQVVDTVPISPVQVVETAPISPVQVVETTPIVADPIQVIETAPEAAEPIIIAQPAFEQ